MDESLRFFGAKKSISRDPQELLRWRTSSNHIDANHLMQSSQGWMCLPRCIDGIVCCTFVRKIAMPWSAIVTKGTDGVNGRNSSADTGAGEGFSIRQPQESCSFLVVFLCEEQQQHSSVPHVVGEAWGNPQAAELAIMITRNKLRD